MNQKKTGTNFLLSVFLLIVLITSMLAPITVSAESVDYQFKSLSAGEWANDYYQYDKKTGKYYTYYQIKINKPGQITFTFSNCYAVILYTSAKDCAYGTSIGSYKYIWNNDKNKAVAVDVGAYYVKVDEGKAKFSFSAAPPATNYCMAAAKTLKSATDQKIMFTPKKNYSRWFKITNPSKKKIIFATSTDYYSRRTEIYNTKFQRLTTVKYGSDLKYCTKTTQPKGTYYICVRYQERYEDEDAYAFGDVVTLRWK